MIARSGKSHLEKLFAGALWDAGWRHDEDPTLATSEVGDVNIAWTSPDGWPPCVAVPQIDLEIAGATYIVDFVFFTISGKVAVELDGHTYHERTPAQATRDRAMDRSFQLDQVPILRFTHLELTRYMPSCLSDVQRMVRLLDDQFTVNELVHSEVCAWRTAKGKPVPRWQDELARVQSRHARAR
jgi:hypothetical protein